MAPSFNGPKDDRPHLVMHECGSVNVSKRCEGTMYFGQRSDGAWEANPGSFVGHEPPISYRCHDCHSIEGLFGTVEYCFDCGRVLLPGRDRTFQLVDLDGEESIHYLCRACVARMYQREVDSND